MFYILYFFILSYVGGFIFSIIHVGWKYIFGPMLDGFILPFKCFIFLLFWMFFSNVRCFIFLCFIIKCFMLIHILYILTDVGCWIFIFCLILNVFIFSILNVGCFMFSLGFLSLSLSTVGCFISYLLAASSESREHKKVSRCSSHNDL